MTSALVTMTLKNIPSTNPHKLSAERVAKVTKAVLRRLVEKGVLPPPQKAVVPAGWEPLKPVQDHPRWQEEALADFRATWDGVLRCAPRLVYRAFHVVQGGKQDQDTNTPQTVGGFASELQVPPAQLMQQLLAAGIAKGGPEDVLTDGDKTALLAHLRAMYDRDK